MNNISKSGLIVTFLRGTSYGSILQAFALQKKLKELGMETKLLQYSRKNSFFIALSNFRLIWFIDYLFIYIFKSKRGLFKIFRIKYLETTCKTFHSKNIHLLATKYSYFIVGSDQVWAPNLYDDTYYLSFTKSNYKFSYGASILYNTFKDFEIKKVKENLSKFNLISVREDVGIKIVKELVKGRDVFKVCDPTFFYDSTFYHNMIRDVKLKDKNFTLPLKLHFQIHHWVILFFITWFIIDYTFSH
jgi:hypothetical protein